LFEFPTTDVLTDYVIIIALFITLSSVIYAVKTYTRNRKLEQIKLLDGILKELKEMQKELTYLVKEPNNEFKLNDWDNRFFNTCDWLAFLINEREVKDTKLENYFKDTFLQAKEMLMSMLKIGTS
jgi:hypothetical protein